MASEYLDVAYITGQTVRLEIVRRADNFRYDWNDATFKNAAWTTRQKTATEDATTLGWYRDAVDPAAWSGGEYLLIVDDAAVATGPIQLIGFSVVEGQFARLGAGVARAAWCQDLSALDVKTLADVRAATWLARLLRERVLLPLATTTEPVNGVGVKVIFDDVTAIATITATNDGTTQTYEDPV